MKYGFKYINYTNTLLIKQSALERLKRYLNKIFMINLDRYKKEIDWLVAEACSFMHIEVNDVYIKNKCRDAVDARSIASYVLRNTMKLPLATIGGIFNKHHASIIHNIKTIGNISSYDDGIDCLLRRLSAELKAKLGPSRKEAFYLSFSNESIETIKELGYLINKTDISSIVEEALDIAKLTLLEPNVIKNI